MITEIEKKEIDKKYFPNGFPYEVKTFDPYSYSNSKRLVEPFESLQEYEATVKSVRHSNALRFFYFIKGLNEADFINEINNQYLNYTLENTENSKHWLSLTYDLVLKGFSIAGKIEDTNLRGAFIKWYKITFNDLQTEATEITTTTSTVDKPKAKDYKTENWFKTGIPLATGEAFNLYRKYKNDKGVFEIITKELGFKSKDRTFFSSTINDNKTVVNNNNTFEYPIKLQRLHKHLTENNMIFGTEFLEKYSQIEPD
jgi:hypothetical protein